MIKDLEDYNVYNEIELKCPKDRSPIFFVNLTADLKERVNSKKAKRYVAKKIVVKGTIEEIQRSNQTKKQFLREFFKYDSGSKKKVNKFDLSKIHIVKVEIIRSIGYGIK